MAKVLDLDSHSALFVGGTPLHNAVQSQSTECTLLLLDLISPAKPESADKEKSTAPPEASTAADSGSAGEGINAADNDLFTPLHIAVCVENLELVRLLLERGAKVNAKNALGRTPLFYAVRAGYAVRCMHRQC